MVDIDGVLADVSHRLHHLARRPKDWDAFFAAAVDDPALPEGLAVVAELGLAHDVVLLSGRPERCRADTLAWLARHGVDAPLLLLRRDRDRRPARHGKLDALRRLAAQRPVAVLVDDDPAVCAAARRAGFAVLRADWASPQPGLFDAQEGEGRT